MKKYCFSSLDEFARLRSRVRDALEELCSQNAELLFIATNEAVNNAIFHGQKNGIPPNVEVILEKKENEMCVVVRHDGVGSSCQDYLKVNAHDADDFCEHGRGMEIIRYCTDYFQVYDSGKKVEMHKQIISA